MVLKEKSKVKQRKEVSDLPLKPAEPHIMCR